MGNPRKQSAIADVTFSLQHTLNKAGCNLAVDGEYGIKTAEAALNTIIVLRKLNEDMQAKLDAAGLVEGPLPPLPPG